MTLKKDGIQTRKRKSKKDKSPKTMDGTLLGKNHRTHLDSRRQFTHSFCSRSRTLVAESLRSSCLFIRTSPSIESRSLLATAGTVHPSGFHQLQQWLHTGQSPLLLRHVKSASSFLQQLLRAIAAYQTAHVAIRLSPPPPPSSATAAVASAPCPSASVTATTANSTIPLLSGSFDILHENQTRNAAVVRRQ